ncbi:nucleotidyltransferase domain-containing protein [Rheinheimera aquimaris]|uniref:Nucleotidyltransferase domain-containing protein n=2 Tax=Rheinheimera TaxID=67575 RepID=A0ABN1DM59_9GAMM|nr:nucleotidyltransferase domain-containing protein [Rheinheimera aquimaris]MCB5213183.1 nucleotidyltransferase domain-containing protein [Rheinheimera aquimaris]
MAKPAGLQLSDNEWQQVNAILQRYLPNNEVWAFGSRVKGNAKPYSDLDLAIISDTPLPLALLAEVAEAFSESDLPWKVDLVDWATTSQRFRQVIAEQKLILTAR